jgi:hypothetical protein
MSSHPVLAGWIVFLFALWALPVSVRSADKHEHAHGSAHQQDDLKFSIRSIQSGDWSNAQTWEPARVPKAGDRVLIARGTTVNYDVASAEVVRLIQVVGTLSFARDRDTELNVGVLSMQHIDECSEDGFACDFEGAKSGPETPDDQWPSLLIGTLDDPIPAKHTARIRLHFLPGFNRDDAPALACCAGRMEIHGSPLSRTWVKLGADANPGDSAVKLAEKVTGWRVGDEVLVTASERADGYGSFRMDREPQTEQRVITKITGQTITLDQPLANKHAGTGEFRAEIANLSRNVIIESADPSGVRGHTVYHAFSRGGISYARLAHLGKEGVLGRYAIHFHLVGDTMRGSSVQGVAIVDSHNRWITIHGTQYLVVRDCIGYKSVGHGYFMEDGTEIYNLLDRNLAIHAYQGRTLPKQVLPFDPNEGAGFWWANGRNTITHNVTTENDEYGYRYDMQHSRYFDAKLPILQPDGSSKKVDVRTIGIWRFEDNEARAEGFYGMVVAANGNSQPDAPIKDQQMLEHIKSIDWTGPDTHHPHIIRGLKISGAHYGFRAHSPSMLLDGLRIDRVTYGVYRPAFENHVYRNLHLSRAGSEPFNRGMDDASAQNGRITVDGLRIDDFEGGNQRHPVVHMTDNNLSGQAECHFRNVTWSGDSDRRPVFNRGGSVRVDPFVEHGVPYFVHDYYGPGEHAKIVSAKAADLMRDGHDYHREPPLTGDESLVAKVTDVAWPKLLDPIDDIPPATIITSVRRDGNQLHVRGVSHDNGEIVQVNVNGAAARIVAQSAGVADWEATLDANQASKLIAAAQDNAGNIEQTAHRLELRALGIAHAPPPAHHPTAAQALANMNQP